MHVFGLNLARLISIGGFVYNRQLDSFVRVVDAGSFNKAARDLYITPVSLIQQVNLLEERLGVQMLTRSRRGVSLTEAGSSLYQDAVEIMRHADLAVERARLIASGDVRVRSARRCSRGADIFPRFAIGWRLRVRRRASRWSRSAPRTNEAARFSPSLDDRATS